MAFPPVILLHLIFFNFHCSICDVILLALSSGLINPNYESFPGSAVFLGSRETEPERDLGMESSSSRERLGHHLPLGQGQLLQAGTLSVLFLAGPKLAWCLVHTEGTS